MSEDSPAMSSPSVALIGLGAMGGAVGARLLERGIDLTVFDISAASVAELVRQGATPAATVDGVQPAEIILLSLPDDHAVHDVLITQGVLKLLSGKTVVDLSTTLPATIREVQAAAQELGVRIVDCPVSGGPADALGGTLILLAGADQKDLDHVTPVLRHLGTVEHVGAVGEGKVVKLVNNMMSMGNIAIAAEAFVLGAHLGVEPKRLYEILSKSGGRSSQFIKRMQYVLDRDFHPRFAVALAEKDLRLALAMGHGATFPLPVTANIHQIYELGVAMGLGREDQVAIVKMYEQWAAQSG